MARFGKKDDIHVTPDTSYIHNPDVAHEASDVNVKSIVIFAVGLAVLTGIVCVLMLLMFRALEAREARKDAKQPPAPMAMTEKEQLPPEPRLQAAPAFGVEVQKEDADRLKEQGFRVDEKGRVDLSLREPQAEMRVVRQLWEAELKGGMDQQTGQQRIPIEQAKHMLLQNGLPARQQTEGSQPMQGMDVPTFWSAGRKTEKRDQ
jgi:hypothetical protein